MNTICWRQAGAPAILLAVVSSLAGACGDGEQDLSPPPRIQPATTEALDRPLTPPRPPCTPQPPPRGFVRREGSTLILEGRRFRALGANLYYLQQLFAEAEQGGTSGGERARRSLDEVVCMGIGLVRAWGFNDTSVGVGIRGAPQDFNEPGLRGLDLLVAEAKARGLRLILPLVNNHDRYGGLPAYAVWAGKTDKDGDQFFGDARMMAYWKDYATMLANRVNIYTGLPYRDEPAIMVIELGNEFRCPSCKGTARFVDTIRELARHAKGAFPRHLIADGGEGHDEVPDLYPHLTNKYPVRGDEGVSFSRLLAVEELDMLSYHMYPALLGINVDGDVASWINGHELLARMAGKVAYLGEFGHNPPAPMRDEVAAPLFNGWLSHLFDARDGSLGLLWQWVPVERLEPPNDDGYAIAAEPHPRTAAMLAWWARQMNR
jgi:mannan endo-1,4-beta-mannosidase